MLAGAQELTDKIVEGLIVVERRSSTTHCQYARLVLTYPDEQLKGCEDDVNA
jgi:hypothetical protein